ncbi:MAG: hypothetical protein M3253_08555, partial [Chloroflexota bacterium]|nr:hypothetical protein [Chloroflexota bacterium]
IYLDATRVGFGALRLGGVRALEPNERRFIEEWEAEAYRRSIDSAAATEGPAQGLVILIAGASVGFGPQLAAGLESKGAHVARLDGQPIKQAVHGVVRRYGGFDVFVANGTEATAESRTEAGWLDEVVRVFSLQRAARPEYRGTVLTVGQPSIGRGDARHADLRSFHIRAESPAELIDRVSRALLP